MKRIYLYVVLVTALVLATGCTTRYATSDFSGPSVSKLEREEIVYVIRPNDGAYGGAIYQGSGARTASIFDMELTKYVKTSYVGSYTDLDKAIAHAKEKNTRYVFEPIIINWVHRKAFLSGKASSVTLRVRVYDLALDDEDQLILDKSLRVKGRNLTFSSQSPEEILVYLVRKYVEEIF